MCDEWISLENLGFSAYEACKLGLVRRKQNERVLKRKARDSQYIKLCIKHDDGTYRNVKVDGLIATTFIG